MYTASVSSVPGTWVPGVHRVCWHNEYAALVKRTLGPTPDPDPRLLRHFRLAFSAIKRVARRYPGQRWTYRETAHSYTGAMRRRYLEAERSLEMDGPLSSRDSFIKAFLKAEKRKVDCMEKPRMIFPRSPRYNLHLASWLKPFEHWLWGNLKSRAISGVGNSRVVAKGLNGPQRANLIRRKMSSIADCVVFEVDGRAFEAHVSRWQLCQEHAVYQTAYPGDEELSRCLGKQLHNVGRTSCGIRFGREGGRASGDFNTGMGNSLVMLAIIKATMTQIDRQIRWDTLVDGDNGLIFISRADAPRVITNFGPVAQSITGHEMALERCVSVLEQVRFGQSGPLRTKKGWTMIRDWRKVLSQATSNHDHLHESKYARQYVNGVARCESVLASGVPVLWAYCRHLLNQTQTAKAMRVGAFKEYEYLGVTLGPDGPSQLPDEPDEVARESFHLAWGLTPDEQISIEKLLQSDQVVVTPKITMDIVDQSFGRPDEF